MTYVKNLISLKAYIPEKKYIIDIIKYCNLKDTDNWRVWIDDYGNILSIDIKKHISIKYNEDMDLQLLNSKDIYYKAHIKKLASINKYSLIAISEEKYYIWMLDDNNILRLCYYLNDTLMENQPILISGLKNLKIIIENLKIEGYVEVNSIIEPLGTDEMKSWATSWPISKDLITLLPEIIKKDLKIV